MLRIRFGGFSVLKITKGLKANWFDKLSYFGGIAGLFSGVSCITGFEIMKLAITLLMMPCQSQKNKAKISDNEESKKSQSEVNENRTEDLERKVNNITEKFGAMERKLILYDYTIIEDNQNFEAYEKEMDIVKKRLDAMNKKMGAIDDKMIEVVE